MRPPCPARWAELADLSAEVVVVVSMVLCPLICDTRVATTWRAEAVSASTWRQYDRSSATAASLSSSSTIVPMRRSGTPAERSRATSLARSTWSGV